MVGTLAAPLTRVIRSDAVGLWTAIPSVMHPGGHFVTDTGHWVSNGGHWVSTTGQRVSPAGHCRRDGGATRV